jgi:type I restriction enzyme, S subunit
VSWNEIQLGDFFQIKHGFAFKSEYFSDAGKHIVLTPGNFYEAGGFRVRPEKERYYIAEPPEDFVLKPGALIVAMTEQGEGLLGSSAIIPSDGSFLHNQRIGLIENLDETHLNKEFLYYLFNSRIVRAQIRASASGTKVRHTAPKRIYSVRVRVPSLPEQKKIAEIIFSYDDLIENNRRRIGLLEEAARLLYREWFVYFRFPGHEHVKIINGLPDGWERISPGSFAAEHIGGGWGKDNPEGKETEPAYVIRGTDIPEVERGQIEGVGLRYHAPYQLESRKLAPYHIVFEVSGGSTNQPIARTLILTPERLKMWDGDVICASFCKRFVMRSREDAVFFYFHIREHRDRGDILVYQKESASSLKNFNFEGFMNGYMMNVPPASLKTLFFEVADNLLRQQAILSAQVEKLISVRDLLLPRLMNGEIAV